MSKLAKVKPKIIRIGDTVFVEEYCDHVWMTAARYRADQKLIRAVKDWTDGIGDYSYLQDAVTAHSKATGGK